MKKHPKTAAEKRHHERIANMACVCCRLLGLTQEKPTEVHHIREGQAAGMGQRSGHFLTLPLCWDCHQGSHGVHGAKSRLRLLKMTEFDLLDFVVGEVVR